MSGARSGSSAPGREHPSRDTQDAIPGARRRTHSSADGLGRDARAPALKSRTSRSSQVPTLRARPRFHNAALHRPLQAHASRRRARYRRVPLARRAAAKRRVVSLSIGVDEFANLSRFAGSIGGSRRARGDRGGGRRRRERCAAACARTAGAALGLRDYWSHGARLARTDERCASVSLSCGSRRERPSRDLRRLSVCAAEPQGWRLGVSREGCSRREPQGSETPRARKNARALGTARRAIRDQRSAISDQGVWG